MSYGWAAIFPGGNLLLFLEEVSRGSSEENFVMEKFAGEEACYRIFYERRKKDIRCRGDADVSTGDLSQDMEQGPIEKLISKWGSSIRKAQKGPRRRTGKPEGRRGRALLFKV